MTIVTGYEVTELATRSTYFELDDSWRSATGKGISVAIIDSGIDTSHPDLEGKVGSSVEARVENKIVVFDPVRSLEDLDSVGHGTACAGIVSRIAPEAELHSIKVLGTGGLVMAMPFWRGSNMPSNIDITSSTSVWVRPSRNFFAPSRCSTEHIWQAVSLWRQQ